MEGRSIRSRRVGRRSLIRSVAAAVALPGALGLLGACAPAPSQPGATAAPSKPTPATAPKAEPKAGGSLTIATSIEPQGLDFNWQSTAGAQDIVQNLFSRLVKPNLETGEVQADAAVEWKSIDPTTWQFSLRDGIKFHNGEPLDAASVKATFDNSLLSDKVPATSTTKTRLARVKAVEAPGPLTVVFKTTEPVSNLPALLYDPALYPAKYYLDQGSEGFRSKPIGSGPFKLTSWAKGSAITLERFDGYFGEKARLDRVIVKPTTEASSRIAALQAGEVQMAMELGPDDVPLLKSQGFQIAAGSFGESWNLNFNVQPTNPLNDIRVRKAINHAIDRDSLVGQILGGLTRRVDSFVGPDAFGYNPDIKGYRYDLALAKSLLKEAGYEQGFDIEFNCATAGAVKIVDVAQYVVAQLQNAGIRVKLNLMERVAFSAKTLDGAHTPLYLDKTFYWPQMDSQRLMSLVRVYPKYKRWISTPELDQTIRDAEQTFDSDKRRKLLQQANQMFFDLAPMAFLYQGLGIAALAKNVQGFKVTPDSLIHLPAVSLS